MGADDQMLADIHTAIVRLSEVMMKHGLSPPQSITLENADDAMRVRGMDISGIERGPGERPANWPADRCAIIGGVWILQPKTVKTEPTLSRSSSGEGGPIRGIER